MAIFILPSILRPQLSYRPSAVILALGHGRYETLRSIWQLQPQYGRQYETCHDLTFKYYYYYYANMSEADLFYTNRWVIAVGDHFSAFPFSAAINVNSPEGALKFVNKGLQNH